MPLRDQCDRVVFRTTISQWPNLPRSTIVCASIAPLEECGADAETALLPDRSKADGHTPDGGRGYVDVILSRYDEIVDGSDESNTILTNVAFYGKELRESAPRACTDWHRSM